jgi:hypothetical protein
MSPNFLSINNKNTSKLQGGSHPYTSQNSQASSSVSLQDLRSSTSRQYEENSSREEEEYDEDLPEPVLPWMKSESRQSIGGSSSRSSVDTTSLHVVKRYAPDPAIKKKQRWTRHKWWLLLSNSLVRCK